MHGKRKTTNHHHWWGGPNLSPDFLRGLINHRTCFINLLPLHPKSGGGAWTLRPKFSWCGQHNRRTKKSIHTQRLSSRCGCGGEQQGIKNKISTITTGRADMCVHDQAQKRFCHESPESFGIIFPRRGPFRPGPHRVPGVCSHVTACYLDLVLTKSRQIKHQAHFVGVG